MATTKRTICVLVILAFAGCKPPVTPTTAPVAPVNSPDPELVKAAIQKKGDAVEFPVSEGTANKLLRGRTDDEVKGLLGAPDKVGPSSDLAYTEWYYTKGKWLKPPEGSHVETPSGMVVCFKDGSVRKLYRIPGQP